MLKPDVKFPVRPSVRTVSAPGYLDLGADDLITVEVRILLPNRIAHGRWLVSEVQVKASQGLALKHIARQLADGAVEEILGGEGL